MIPTQVRAMLPDLGEGFVEACLAFHQFNVATVVNKVLEDDLPPQLAGMDRKLARYRVNQGKVERGDFKVGSAVKGDEEFALAQKEYLKRMEDEEDEEAFLMAEYNDEYVGGGGSLVDHGRTYETSLSPPAVRP